MTETTLEALAGSDVSAAVDAGRLSAEPHQLTLGGYHVLSTPRGVEKIDLTGDQYRDLPKRIRRSVVVENVASFLAYWSKYATGHSELYADQQQRRIVGVVDAPADSLSPAWCEHKVVLHLNHSPTWLAWFEQHCRYLGQETFAEFIEDRLAEIIQPDPADMLEVAQTLQATTRVNFRSGYRIQDGQRQIGYVEETEGRAGVSGQLEIPARFRIALPVWRGDQQAIAVDARLRYRINDGRLLLGYVLDRLDRVVDEAFGEVVDQVATGTGQAVMRGQP